MQCKLRFPLLQHIISISTRSMFPAPAPPSPADFDPFPAPPCTVGKGGVPPPQIFGQAPPRPAPPREKISFPAHLCRVVANKNFEMRLTLLLQVERPRESRGP